MWQIFLVHPISRLSQPQKIVVVVALGAALLPLGTYLISLGGGNSVAPGWYAYAPLTASSNAGGLITGPSVPFWQHSWARLLTWLVLTVIWAVAALWVLRPRANSVSQ
jgi:hypothetical protein